ncbi:MAG: nucleoside deaminase [Magnetococcus sp. DMHC-1]
MIEATQSALLDEVPVGAVVRDVHGRYLAQSGNRPVANMDPAGHAEMQAMRLAANRVGNYRLVGAQLTVTLEPCAMCLETSRQARFGKIVYGMTRTKTTTSTLPTRSMVEETTCSAEIIQMLKFFFESKRSI